MKIGLFVLPVAAILLCPSGSGAAPGSASSSSTETGRQSAPTIKFLRPIKGEQFFNFPIFMQVEVTGYHLVLPDKPHSGTVPANTGHICFSLDDYPVYETEDTQIMIGKFIGPRYLPVGWHVLKAQLVDVNDRPLDPPVMAVTSVFTAHNALVESDHAENGSQQAELVANELHNMRAHLEEVKKGLQRIETGSTGFVPTPPPGSVQTGE